MTTSPRPEAPTLQERLLAEAAEWRESARPGWPESDITAKLLEEAAAALTRVEQAEKEQRQAANHWFTEANAEHNRAEKLYADLLESRQDVHKAVSLEVARWKARAEHAEREATRQRKAHDVLVDVNTGLREQLAQAQARITALKDKPTDVVERESGHGPGPDYFTGRDVGIDEALAALSAPPEAQTEKL